MELFFRNVTKEDKDFYFQIRKTTIKPYTDEYADWNEENEYSKIASKINIAHDQIIVYKENDIGLYSVDEFDDCIYIEMLNFLPEYQSMGFGSQILCLIKVEAELKNKSIKLNTYQNNLRAISFYQKNGFVITHFKNEPGKYPKVYMEFNTSKSLVKV
jgi:ribosomal protein S18 acetylase RimI-like enzyme